MAHKGMTFGIFLAPFHRIGENPTLALNRDMELIEWMDYLGYDEVWIGEHHSAGWELIASPEIFIAAAAERTKHIMLGSGVTSLPYHHPLLVAQRFVQLDHMTRGRAMLGCGPGALVSDAYMMGIEPVTQRPRMDEALDAIMLLLKCEEPVTLKTDWFELRQARLHLAPYTEPHFPIAVASVMTPSGVMAAGRHGLGVLSLGAGLPGGPDALAKLEVVVARQRSQLRYVATAGLCRAGRATRDVIESLVEMLTEPDVQYEVPAQAVSDDEKNRRQEAGRRQNVRFGLDAIGLLVKASANADLAALELPLTNIADADPDPQLRVKAKQRLAEIKK